MNLKQLIFCASERDCNTRAASINKNPRVQHQGRTYRLIKALPLSSKAKMTLIDCLCRKKKTAQKEIEATFASAFCQNRDASNFLAEVEDCLLSTLYHRRMNELGMHLAEYHRSTFSKAYLRDIGEVMQGHVKGRKTNGIFMPTGGASSWFTTQAFHILQRHHPDDSNSLLNARAAQISDQLLLSWLDEGVLQKYHAINDALARAANTHLLNAAAYSARRTHG
jgi:protoporphyrinogen oxidase